MTAAPESLTLDELLESQSKVTVVATIEAIPGHTEKVKVTPWLKDQGCMCGVSVNISKTAIQSIRPTGDVHFCCGKSLKVVEITFTESKDIDIPELIAGLVASVRKTTASNPLFNSGAQGAPQLGVEVGARPAPGHGLQCENAYAACLQRCQYDADPMFCSCNCGLYFGRCNNPNYPWRLCPTWG